MHFSIPDTQECIEQNGSSYIGYNIHINGEFHCTLRYKQLHSLNELLRKSYGSEIVPTFPPKKYWPLTPNQVEERRSNLEKYIQIVGQNRIIINSDIFNKFLLNAQQDSSGEKVQDVNIEVFLLNGYKISLDVKSNESSSSVLEKVCTHINLPLTYICYFSLFLIRKDDGGDTTIIRKLHDLESPYLSQKGIQDSPRIIVRKSYWDNSYDVDVMHERGGLNLLYVQTVRDIEKGWIVCSKDVHSRLAALQATGSKREYMELARTLAYYGYIEFKGCRCNYPEERRVIVSAGCWELRVRGLTGTDTQAFRVTRMRAWRITTHRGDRKELELSFEYLVEKERLQWVTISSHQSLLMSICLQGMVDDLLLKKSGVSLKQFSNSGWLRNEALSGSSSADTLSSSNGSGASPVEGIMSMRRLSEKLNGLRSVENDAFEGIGDDDL